MQAKLYKAEELAVGEAAIVWAVMRVGSRGGLTIIATYDTKSVATDMTTILNRYKHFEV